MSEAVWLMVQQRAVGGGVIRCRAGRSEQQGCVCRTQTYSQTQPQLREEAAAAALDYRGQADKSTDRKELRRMELKQLKRWCASTGGVQCWRSGRPEVEESAGALWELGRKRK